MAVEKGAFVPVVVIAPQVPEKDPDIRPGFLPFTAADVVHYFSTTLDMSSEKGANGASVFQNHDPQPEDRWRIEVQTEEKSVIVEFTVDGNYGLSLAREFFESPLFERDEYERFYAMLNDAKNHPVDEMPRFTVKMTMRKFKDSEILTLRFTPRIK